MLPVKGTAEVPAWSFSVVGTHVMAPGMTSTVIPNWSDPSVPVSRDVPGGMSSMVNFPSESETEGIPV